MVKGRDYQCEGMERQEHTLTHKKNPVGLLAYNYFGGNCNHTNIVEVKIILSWGN